MTFALWFSLIMAVAVMVLVRWAKNQNKQAAKEQAEEAVKYQKRAAFKKRLAQLTPNDKPLFFYNKLQNTWAFTSYYRMTDQGSERKEIATSGGDKLLVNKTASITLYGFDSVNEGGGQREIFDHLIIRTMGCEKGDLYSDFYAEARRTAHVRLFQLCEDLYVQIGTKVPPGTTRAEVERFNTRCRIPSEIWEALEADIAQTIQSRTQAG